MFSFNYHKGAMWVVEPGQGESQHRGGNAGAQILSPYAPVS